jgi:hypothetical protein
MPIAQAKQAGSLASVRTCRLRRLCKFCLVNPRALAEDGPRE